MQELHIENLGPIRSASVKLRPLTVLIGPNNAGKSYAALLIYATHDPFNRFMFTIWSPFLSPESGALRSKLTVTEVEASALKAWLQDWKKDKHDFSIGDLPDLIQARIGTIVDTIVEETPAALTRELQRCFASELDDLIRAHSTGKARVVLKGREPRFELDMTISAKKLKLLRAAFDWREIVIPGPVMAGIDESHVTAFLMGLVFGKLFSGRTYYLPAARSGILQGHKLLAGVVLSRMPLIGIETFNIPKLSGVVADFISHILNIEARGQSKAVAQVADFLEKEVCQGKIKRKAGDEKTEFPEIYYQMNGKEIPLHRTSSMVSEVAPIILFLRSLVNRGDLLIIEEPEAHLHPDNQRVVAQAIVRLIRAGVRVLVTTHSDYFVQQLSNFVLLAKEPSKRDELGYGENEYLNGEEVGAYLFQFDPKQGGSTSKELRVTDTEGIPEDEFVAIANQIYQESALLERPR